MKRNAHLLCVALLFCIIIGYHTLQASATCCCCRINVRWQSWFWRMLGIGVPYSEWSSFNKVDEHSWISFDWYLGEDYIFQPSSNVNKDGYCKKFTAGYFCLTGVTPYDPTAHKDPNVHPWLHSCDEICSREENKKRAERAEKAVLHKLQELKELAHKSSTNEQQQEEDVTEQNGSTRPQRPQRPQRRQRHQQQKLQRQQKVQRLQRQQERHEQEQEQERQKEQQRLLRLQQQQTKLPASILMEVWSHVDQDDLNTARLVSQEFKRTVDDYKHSLIRWEPKFEELASKAEARFPEQKDKIVAIAKSRDPFETKFNTLKVMYDKLKMESSKCCCCTGLWEARSLPPLVGSSSLLAEVKPNGEHKTYEMKGSCGKARLTHTCPSYQGKRTVCDVLPEDDCYQQCASLSYCHVSFSIV